MPLRLCAFSMVVLLAACGAGQVSSSDDTSLVADDVSGTLPALAADVPRLYWGGSALDFGGTGRTFFRSFDAQGGTPFTVSVTNYDDGGEPDVVPFQLRLYYASGSRWRLYRVADSKASTATVVANPRKGHRWLVVMRATKDFYVLQSYLACSAAQSACEVELQPGDACDTTFNGCDEGLYCDNGSACGTAGTCRDARNVCSFKAQGTVCGCDGQDYADACAAATAGVGMAFAGACERPPQPGCDPTTSWANMDIALGGIEKVGVWASGDGATRYAFDPSTAVVTMFLPDGSTDVEDYASDESDPGLLDIIYPDGTVHPLRERSNCAGELELVAQWKIAGGLTLYPSK